MAEFVLPIQKGFYVYLGEEPEPEIFWYKWAAIPGGINGQLLAARKKPFALLHRYIAKALPQEVVVFKDSQTWNCRPENLLKMTRAEWKRWQEVEEENCPD